MPLKVPISTLRVFEAAARWQSFHAAASELNLTASAVSHSIRKLEETLGVVLFERIGRGVSSSWIRQPQLPASEIAVPPVRFQSTTISAVREDWVVGLIGIEPVTHQLESRGRTKKLG